MQAHGALFEKTTVNGKVTSARAIIEESDDLDTRLSLLDKGHWKHIQMSNQDMMHIIKDLPSQGIPIEGMLKGWLGQGAKKRHRTLKRRRRRRRSPSRRRQTQRKSPSKSH